MVKDIVIKIIQEQFGSYSSPIDEDTDFVTDLNADSVDIVGLIMAFEDEFGLEFEDAEIHKVKKVGDVVKYIIEKTEE